MTSAALGVLIVDDHQLVAEVVASHLKALGGFEAEVASSLPQAMQMIEERGGYDVVLLDLWIPGAQGLTGLKTMIDANFGKPVALFSGNMSALVVREAMRMGAASCIPKTLPAKSLVNTLRFVGLGEIFLPFQLAEDAATDDPVLGALSERERQVLEGLRTGKPNKEIGRELGLSEVTVKMHVRAICAKLGAKNRTQAALIAQSVRAQTSDLPP